MNEESSFEELAAVQSEHETRIAAQKRAEIEETARIERERAAGETGYKERLAFLEQAGLSQAEIDKMKAAKIEERMANSEKLRESAFAKEEELKRTRGLIQEANERIAKLEELVAGKAEAEIAAPVKEALEKARSRKTGIDRDTVFLAAELEKLSASQVSDAEVNRFTQLQGQLETLNSDIAKIEGNPFVIDRLIEEAKTEDRMREVVVREAASGVVSPERRNFIKEACQKFLSEEFSARGIDKIKDPKEKEEAMRELVQEISIGVGGGVDSAGLRERLRREPKEGERIGSLLKNLTGTEGTLAGTAQFFRNAVGKKTSLREKGVGLSTWEHQEYDADKTKDAVRDLIGRHLGTLNFVRSRALGTRRHQGNVMGGSQRFGDGDWGDFGREISTYGFSVAEGGPIFPRDASPSVIEDAGEKFLKDKEEAQKLEQKMTTEEVDELNRRASYLEEELKKAESSLERARGAEKIIKDLKERFRDLKNKIVEVDSRIRDANEQIIQRQEAKSRLGPLSFIQKGKEDKAIAYWESKLLPLKAEKSKLEEARRSLTEAENTLKEEAPAYKIEERITGRKRELANLKDRLGVLKK